MREIVYSLTGGTEVLRMTDRPVQEPAAGEARVRVVVSGVNPTDWKTRRGPGPGQRLSFAEVVPNQDGAGLVDAVGPGVAGLQVGDRVWLYETAWQRADGTAQEYVTLPAEHAVLLPGGASFDVGASLGVPALTAHRCLTVHDGGPGRLSPGSFAGRVVLVSGGAGAVGHAAIQLARWAGATVVTTVSSVAKAQLASAAGAHHVVNYRDGETVAAVRAAAPNGVDIVVEVAAAQNAELDRAVAAVNASVAVYADTASPELVLPIRPHMVANTRFQFVLLYTVPRQAKADAIEDVSAAVAAGAMPVGEDAGLPLHRFPLAQTAAAHAAVEGGVTGKVLIDVPAG